MILPAETIANYSLQRNYLTDSNIKTINTLQATFRSPLPTPSDTVVANKLLLSVISIPQPLHNLTDT